MRPLALLLPLLLFPARGSAEPAASSGSAVSPDREEWYVVEFSGTPVGIGRDRWVSSGDGLFYESYIEIRARRLGTPLEMAARVEEWDDANRELLRFTSETIMNGERMVTRGERTPDGIYVTVVSTGSAQVDTVAWEAGALGVGWLDDVLRERLQIGETSIEIRMFDPQFAAFRTTRFEHAGRDENGYVMLDQFEEGHRVPMARLWLDESLTTTRMVSRQLNMELSMRRIAPEAVDELELDPNFDVIREQMIKCPGYPGPPEALDEVEFTLHFAHPLDDPAVFDGPNQRVVSSGSNILRLAVTRAPNGTAPGGGDPALFLRPARYIQSNDPGIRAVADSIAQATGLEGAALAAAITRWVGGYVSDKGYGRGFSSAADVLRSRSGDCSEHSVLLAALLRAAGIPARIVVGLAYDSGDFIGHMWTEAWVDGWITLDALDPDNDPRRIRIATAPDARAVDETDVVTAYSLVAGLEVEVTGYRRRD